MAASARSPSLRHTQSASGIHFDKENVGSSPSRVASSHRLRISSLKLSPTMAPLDSLDTLDSPTRDEISRAFGTHYAKVLSKRTPLSPLGNNSPRAASRGSKLKTIPSAPSSPMSASKAKHARSPLPALKATEVAPEVEFVPQEPMSLQFEQPAPEIAAPVPEPVEAVVELSDEPYYDEYGFECDKKRGKSSKSAPTETETGESLLRDGDAGAKKPPSTSVEETSQWWEKWLSELTIQSTDANVPATIHPLAAPGSPVVASTDPWRPVAAGMVMQYGVPHQLRRRVWPALARVEALQRKVLQSCTLSETPTTYYRTLLKSNNFEHQTWSRIIRLDLDRTFATHKIFRERGGAGQQHLSNVLTAYAHHNPAIGYCQGMSFVAATLLMVTECDEVEAFWLLCAMMDAPEYGMCGYYSPGMQGLLADSAHLNNLLRMAIPQVHQHFSVKCNIDVVYFTARWWLSMFTDLGSWSTTLRMWDLFFAEGRKSLQRVSIALLSLCKHDILGQDTLDGVMPYILNIPAAKLESSLLFQNVDDVDLADLQLKFLYWQKEQQSKEQKKEKLEKLRKEKVLKLAAPTTPGGTARSLFARIWEKIATPSQSDGPETYKYTQLATSSPPNAARPIPLQPAVATTGRAKRKRSDAILSDTEGENDGVVDLGDPAQAASFVNVDLLPNRKLTFDQDEIIESPSKRRKTTDNVSRSSSASTVVVDSSDRAAFMEFATPTKRRNL